MSTHALEKITRDRFWVMSLAPRRKCPRNVVQMKEAMAAFHYLIQIKHSNHWKEKEKKPCSVKDGFKVLILKLHPFSMKRLNADTKVHLAHVQAFFINWKVLLEKKYFCFTFSEKKKNNKITTRCLSNFKGPIVSYLSATLSHSY